MYIVPNVWKRKFNLFPKNLFYELLLCSVSTYHKNTIRRRAHLCLIILEMFERICFVIRMT